jgi:hypothetical protein
VNCKCQLGNAYWHQLSWKKRVQFKILYATVSMLFLTRLIPLLFPFKILEQDGKFIVKSSAEVHTEKVVICFRKDTRDM